MSQENSTDALDILIERGFVKDTTDVGVLRSILAQPATFYWGCDATATSFHAGNQVGMMAAAWLQRCGHRPIILMGGGTTMVGDPSGKTSERPMMSKEDIVANEARLKPQFERFLSFDAAGMMLDNSEWLSGLNLLDFLREVGSRASVNHMLSHETYRNRLEKGGLSFLEFSYQLLQAYDYLHLYREYRCRLQVGGSDQWANIVAGVDLVRRAERREASALVWPLLTTAGGEKMGKSAAGAVWLDAAMLSPYEYYQYWINVDDADVERLLALYTFLPMSEVRRLGSLPGDRLREAKEVLAHEATTIVHGADAATDAREASRAIFSGGRPVSGIPTVIITRGRLEAGINIVDLAVEVAGLYDSRREGVRKIGEGGLYLNDAKVESPQLTVTANDLAGDSTLLLRSGKKRHLRVEVAN